MTRFEEVSRTFDEIHKNSDELEEKIKQLEISKSGPVSQILRADKLEEIIKQLELCISKSGPASQILLSDTDKNPINPGPAFQEDWMKEDMTHPMRFKLPPFDGKASWSVYLKQFEAIAISLTAALRGDAADILRSIPKGKEKCYKTLITRLEKRSGDSHLQQVYKAQLRSRVQRTSENLQEFEADMARMVRLAYSEAPVSILEEIAVDVFIIGLRERESEIQKALRIARPKVLDEALAIALEHEIATQTSKGLRTRAIGKGDEESLEEKVRKIIHKTMPKKRDSGGRNCNCKKPIQQSEKQERVDLKRQSLTLRSKAPVITVNITSSGGVHSLYINGRIGEVNKSFLIGSSAARIMIIPEFSQHKYNSERRLARK